MKEICEEIRSKIELKNIKTGFIKYQNKVFSGEDLFKLLKLNYKNLTDK